METRERLKELVARRHYLKQANKRNDLEIGSLGEEIKALVDVDQTIEVDGYRICHYRGRGQCEADAWEMEVLGNPEVKAIEENFKRAKAVRDTKRAEYSYETTCLRITEVEI